ncbi:substrate-binding domain-containing protein [Corynebacterium sp. HS2168-gen11]|uniref:substrate-binding domain-containing protein n=1 Tax=Corynebacterium sp. HS2168-gen11 TaxID=2974027 RepID=UPI00216AC364|nr:substrate-binding domain-containing protein [Corynebacterium sp. HS2168-gen11]MCS4535287.1 substrate-binding domain-containing protein [Corynebacterium sp. HS2168-gen11]
MFSTIVRKTLTIVSATALSLSVAACQPQTPQPHPHKHPNTVAFSISSQTNPFFTEMREGAEAKAQELGIRLLIEDAYDDPAEQASQLSTVAEDGAHAVIIQPTDPDAIIPSVAALNALNIPVLTVDLNSNGGDIASFIRADNRTGGQQAAALLGAALHGEGEILILEGDAKLPTTNERTAGFQAGLKQFPNITVSATQSAKFDRAESISVTKQLLDAHPKVKAIFAENDEMALGAIEALEERAGTDVLVVGFDGTPQGLAAVQEGTMFATIMQQPREIGARAVQEAAKALTGERLTAEIPLPVITVTKENINDFS